MWGSGADGPRRERKGSSRDKRDDRDDGMLTDKGVNQIAAVRP